MEKVKANQSVYPMEATKYRGEQPGMPIKLQIAKDLMAAHIEGCVHAGFPYKPDEVAQHALQDAEALIDAYNNS